MKILEDELQQNFRVTTDEIGSKSGDESEVYEVTAVPPPVVLKMKRRRELFKTKRKPAPLNIAFDLSEEVLETYRAASRRRRNINSDKGTTEDITDRLENQTFTQLTLVSEIARYFSGDDISPFDIEDIMENASPATERVVELVNISNEIVYDVIIPTLFRALFDIESFGKDSEEEIELVKGYNATENRPPTFRFRAKPHLVAGRDYPEFAIIRDRTFHLDNYCFDSQPELDFFKSVLGLDAADRIYFTGMLVHGQSGFRVNYIHPESHTVCNYYPDFLIMRDCGEIYLVEIKTAWKENDPIVIAKREAAELLAFGNEFHYALLTRDDFDGFLSTEGWQAFERPSMLPPA